MYEDVSKVFEGLGHPARIAALMMVETTSMGAIAEAVGMSRPALQRHVSQLRRLGLIDMNKRRKWSLTDLGIEAKRLIPEFQRLATRVAEVNRVKAEVFSLESLEQTVRTGLLEPKEAKRLLSKAVSTGALKSPDAKSRAKLMLRKLDQTAKNS
jgi:DNA-binding transcriptional ArsR family regulator